MTQLVPSRTAAFLAALLLACAAPLGAQAPGSVESYLKEGRTALEARSYWMATIQFRQAVSLAPGNAQAHFLLGSSLASEGKWEEARASFARATEIDPSLRDRAAEWLAGAPAPSAPADLPRPPSAGAAAPAPAPSPARPRTPTQAPAPAPPASGGAFRVGDAVEVEHVKGVWRAGVVTRVVGSGCPNYTVRYPSSSGGTADLPFGCTQVRRPTGNTTPIETAGRGGALVLGDYACDYRPNLQSVPQQKGTLTLLANGRYRYLSNGDTGRFEYDAASGAITWLSGPMADRAPERTLYRRNQNTTQIDIRFGYANEWSCGRNLTR